MNPLARNRDARFTNCLLDSTITFRWPLTQKGPAESTDHDQRPARLSATSERLRGLSANEIGHRVKEFTHGLSPRKNAA